MRFITRFTFACFRHDRAILLRQCLLFGAFGLEQRKQPLVLRCLFFAVVFKLLQFGIQVINLGTEFVDGSPSCL